MYAWQTVTHVTGTSETARDVDILNMDRIEILQPKEHNSSAYDHLQRCISLPSRRIILDEVVRKKTDYLEIVRIEKNLQNDYRVFSIDSNCKISKENKDT